MNKKRMTPSKVIEKFKRKRAVGVYCLINKGEVIYVGSSENLSARIYSHTLGDKEFDSVEVHPCSRKDKASLEAALIVDYKPTNNSSLPYSDKYITLNKCVSTNRAELQQLVKELPVLFMNERIWYVEKEQYEQLICEMVKVGREYVKKINDEFVESGKGNQKC